MEGFHFRCLVQTGKQATEHGRTILRRRDHVGSLLFVRLACYIDVKPCFDVSGYVVGEFVVQRVDLLPKKVNQWDAMVRPGRKVRLQGIGGGEGRGRGGSDRDGLEFVVGGHGGWNELRDVQKVLLNGSLGLRCLANRQRRTVNARS